MNGTKGRSKMKTRYWASVFLALFMAFPASYAEEAAPAGGATPSAGPSATGPSDSGRKKVAKQLAECAGCQKAADKAKERAGEATDKIGAAQCETCQGYWAANGNDKNGGLHFSKKCQQCVRMEAAGRDGPCDACQKAHDAKKKHGKN